MTPRRPLSLLLITLAGVACGSSRPVVPDIDASEESDAAATPDGDAPVDAGSE